MGIKKDLPSRLFGTKGFLPRYHPNSRRTARTRFPDNGGITRLCLHSGSQANQTTPCKPAYSRRPALSAQGKLVIFLFQADNILYL